MAGLIAASLTSPAAAQDLGANGRAERRTNKKEPAAASPRPADASSAGRVAVAATESRPAVAPPPAAAASPGAEPPQVTETEIVASEGADFESKSRVATFNGSVHVADARFELWCDKLTVYLNKTTEKGANPLAAGTPAPAPAATAGEKKDDPGGGGIDRAQADGHVVIVQRRAATEPGANGQPKVSTGRAEKAVFVNKTGEMTLSGSPRVQQDINEHVATSPGTVMILGRDNTLRTLGPSKTLIRQRPDANEKPPGAPAGGATPNRPGGRG